MKSPRRGVPCIPSSFTATTMPSLHVRESHRLLQIARPGRLQKWLGPALRGLTGGRLRAHACTLPVLEQITTQKYCKGCSQMAGCQYGETFEPDPPQGLLLQPGWENTARPMVLAPQFPLPEFPPTGFTFGVTLTLIGQAARHQEDVWEALRIGGADLGLGLGEDHVLFDVLPVNSDEEQELVFLEPGHSGETVPEVEIEFLAPLFLTKSEGDRKTPILRPTFAELMRAGLRTLGPLHRVFGKPLPEQMFSEVKKASETVGTRKAGFEKFEQGKWSHRTKERFLLEGVAGRAVYGPMPKWLLPWVSWAGRLHVGTHRVAGAGGWRVISA
jgi:hypothetical protein